MKHCRRVAKLNLSARARMRIPIVIVALIVGGWLAFDGTRALTTGDYVTVRAGELGPWSHVVAAFGIDPRGTVMKWAHAVLGIAWLVSAAVFLSRVSAAWYALIGCSVLTLWYLPLGTVLSVAEIILLLLPAVRGLK
jgi:hypothetical protein